MPRDNSIQSVLVIGSGPIVIGQACEFDYSGTQACRVLRAEGIRVILVNSNPATIMTDPEFADATYIEPITWEVVERIIATEKPDAILIFTDPRFFTWLFEMEDEIHQICPIAWWHVWDNYPAPEFNRSMYEATDLINCHSYLTYEICKSMFPDKTNFIPHAVPTEIFKQLPKNEISTWKAQLFGQNKKDNFIAFWNNRNARRKRPADVLESWKIFLDLLNLIYQF